ncbi:MAG: sigma-70 family RNA polymerase sigma factor [Myxococcales bacterium]|nr:sigma-70 family RNA polymerase sigma factor [Myxococcales bacterium]MBK7192141.1 sigma-70 family RNA polymerase sigma factor [Myxococcales bacterium]MBP6846252.1 sigma-70 family RNA polymerase sigma factor [Kofleriaceae bacterium]
MDPDRELLERWRAGDQAAGRDLFARFFDPLFRFFANKCNEPDELVQATFFALVKARDQFAGRSSFRTYLFTIARNELYRWLRTFKRERGFDPELSSIAEVATTAGSRLARNEEHRRLCAALRTLPVESQTLLELHYWEGLDATALAEVFDAQVATIRQRLSRARVALKDALAASEGAPLPALATVEDMDTWAKSLAG